MGTYYALGIGKEFDAYTNATFTSEKWQKILNERFDIDLYNIDIQPNSVEANLKQGVFEENIEDLYRLLKQITQKESIDYYFTRHGTKKDEYSSDIIVVHISDEEGNKIRLRIKLILLFIEGKVLAEEFSCEPKIVNWLFRHSNLNNKLAGCIIG